MYNRVATIYRFIDTNRFIVETIWNQFEFELIDLSMCWYSIDMNRFIIETIWNQFEFKLIDLSMCWYSTSIFMHAHLNCWVVKMASENRTVHNPAGKSHMWKHFGFLVAKMEFFWRIKWSVNFVCLRFHIVRIQQIFVCIWNDTIEANMHYC